MIYLIGGPPKCGKTTLAKQLSKSAGIPWVSTDTLQNVIKPYIAEQDFAAKFPLSSMNNESNDEKYAQNTTNEIINAYQQQAKTVYDAVKAFVASEIADGNDYVIEGYHVEPVLIKELTTRYPDMIRGIIVIKKDVNKFLEDIHKSTTPNDWILARTKDEATFPKIAAMIMEYGAQLEREAEQQAIKVICTDGDFANQLQEASVYLLNSSVTS
jgi:2-phosphoglycerate kinase